MDPYVALLIMLAASLFIALAGLGTSAIIGPYRPNKTKVANYECGIEPALYSTNSARFPIKFYLTAMAFIVFDIEVVFIYPWAANFAQLGSWGFLVMATFFEILTVPFLYIWFRGGFEWD